MSLFIKCKVSHRTHFSGAFGLPYYYNANCVPHKRNIAVITFAVSKLNIWHPMGWFKICVFVGVYFI